MNTCDKCKFCNEEGINKDTMRKYLSCRRFPPTPQIVPGSQGPITVSSFPTVTGEQFCGEWQPQLVLVN